tara:strand:- start:366 stop:1520 length:1155 start_codon:yes stop_codon:yes gene_type:complete
MIPYGQHSMDQDDIDAVVRTLKSNMITQGPLSPKFEERLAKKVESKYCAVVNSATSALHISCLSLGLKAGDVMWTVPNSFVASANCGLYCGAKVDFVDIDVETSNMDVIKLEEKLIESKKKNNLPKIVIPVHFAGQSSEQKKIWMLSKKYGFKIIEDASHSLGAKHRNQKVGNCKWSDIVIFSFHPVKMITTAEGGAALTNKKEIYLKLKQYSAHGIIRDKSRMKFKQKGAWYYEQQVLGYNYRLSDLHAALGISQLKKLSRYLVRRNEIARYYDSQLDTRLFRLPSVKEYNYSSFHLYVIRIDKNMFPGKHKKIFNLLRKKNIIVNLHYIPIHLHPYYRELGFKEGDFPVSERFSSEAISLPIFPSLSKKQQDFVIDVLHSGF